MSTIEAGRAVGVTHPSQAEAPNGFSDLREVASKLFHGLLAGDVIFGGVQQSRDRSFTVPTAVEGGLGARCNALMDGVSPTVRIGMRTDGCYFAEYYRLDPQRAQNTIPDYREHNEIVDRVVIGPTLKTGARGVSASLVSRGWREGDNARDVTEYKEVVGGSVLGDERDLSADEQAGWAERLAVLDRKGRVYAANARDKRNRVGAATRLWRLLVDPIGG